VIPNIFISIFYGLIPLGDPEADVFESNGPWTYLFIIIPFSMVVVGYLNEATFYGCAQYKHPFSTSLPTSMVVFFIEIIILVPLSIVIGQTSFEFFGVVALAICYFTVFLNLYIHLKAKEEKTTNDLPALFQYAKIVLAIFVHIVVLTLYIIAFALVPSGFQPVLTFFLAIITFFFRKLLLSLTDVFPLEMAMLIASFWVENMDDMFQTLAYPSIRQPITYIAIWIINLLANVANLLFLTPQWYRCRVFTKGLCACRCFGEMPKANEFELKDERGHSYNRPGYLRRQVRFYFWKIFSQFAAAMFYLFISAVLRFYFFCIVLLFFCVTQQLPTMKAWGLILNS